MELLTQAVDWLVAHESILSGIAAVVAILGVVFALAVKSYRYITARVSTGSSSSGTGPRVASFRPQVRYCQLPDNHRIAWAMTGTGFPLVRSLGWFTNLDVESSSPVASAFWDRLARKHTLVRYDGRGIGLSDRDIEEFSLSLIHI